MTEKKRGFWSRLFGRKPTQLAQLRPGPIADRPPRGQQWTFDETLERQFALSNIGQVLAQINEAYRRAEYGYVEPMIDLFERRIEGDAHLRAALDNRNEAVSQKPWTIEPGGGRDQTEEDRKAAAMLEDRLRLVPNFITTIEHQLTFNGIGWAGSEMTWDVVDGLAAPVWFQDVTPRRFTFEQTTDRPMLRVTEDPLDGVPLTPGKWWWTQRRGRLTAISGLMRTALWWSTFKIVAVRDWMIYADRFGLPFVTGQYDETIGPDDKEALRDAVRDLGTDGFAIFSDAAKIVIHDAQARGRDNTESVHAALAQLCDNQISFLIEGATLVSSVDGPGSHALGKVHENRYFDLLQGDSNRVGQSFETSVGLPFVKFNGLTARPPRLRMHLGLNLSMTEWVSNALALTNGLEDFPLDNEQIRTRTQLREPRAGNALIGIDAAKLAKPTPAPVAPTPPDDGGENEIAENDSESA